MKNSKGAVKQFSKGALNKINKHAYCECVHITWLVINPLWAAVFTVHSRHCQSSAALQISELCTEARCSPHPSKTFSSTAHLLIVQPQLLNANICNKFTVHWAEQDSLGGRQYAAEAESALVENILSPDFRWLSLQFLSLKPAAPELLTKVMKRTWNI